ncbi:MAG: hypothetical protein AAGG81_08760 [Chlamydiota bacterium]
MTVRVISKSDFQENNSEIIEEETPPFLCEVEDTRNNFQCATDTAKCIYGLTKMTFSYIGNFAFYYNNQEKFEIHPQETGDTWSYDESRLPWSNSESSEGLYLFAPGLDAPTRSWGPLIKEIIDKDPEAHCVLPNLVEKGDASIEKVGQPLVDIVRNYLQKFPKKPIHLLGTSRGGQLIAYIEKELESEKMVGRDLFVVCVAGVIYGTKNIDWQSEEGFLNRVAKLKHNEETLEELSWGNEKVRNLVQELQKKQKVWAKNNTKAKHLFVGTVNDELVTYTSSLPFLDGDVTYELLRGETHVSIVSNSSEIILQWFEDKKIVPINL